MSKILTIDIECMANLVWSWSVYGSDWSAIDTEREWYPLGVGYKWLDETEAHYLALEDYKGYKPQIKRFKDGSVKIRQPNLKHLMSDVWELLNTADVVVSWNGKSFDIKKLNSCIIALGMKPYMPFKQVDVMREKKKLASSNRNTLDYTSEEWGTGRKQTHEGWNLWIKCAEGDKKALKEMAEYCKRDVVITEKNYLYLRPWIESHPAMNILDETPEVCPKGCGGKMQAGRTYASTKANKYQYFRCADCGATAKSRIPEKIEKPLYN